jgi:hypothetical protein
MTPEQFQKFIKSNSDVTKEAIQLHVNGKIDKMVDKLDHHLEKFNEHVADDKEFQDGMSDNLKWITRLIIGAVVLGGIGMIIK